MEKESVTSLVSVFKALGCHTRFRLVTLLSKERLCVGMLAEKLGISQPAVSQHLRVLKQAGLVTDEKCGYHSHYRLNLQLLQEAGSSLINTGRRTCPNPCSREENECATVNAATLKSSEENPKSAHQNR